LHISAALSTDKIYLLVSQLDCTDTDTDAVHTAHAAAAAAAALA